MNADIAIRFEVLHVPGCPNLAPMLDRLHQVTEAPVRTREITTDADAAAFGMAGSPTLLINGVDPFRAPGDNGCAVACRLYRDHEGRVVPAPSVDQLRRAIATAACSAAPDEVEAGEALRVVRARAVALDAAQKAVHQAILRHFAATGRPPAPAALAPVPAGDERPTTVVLSELQDLDAIRLGPDGRVVVAYPFSATPTRHRVRIAGRTEVYAMCAIDALGISAMLGQDTRIDSGDGATGRPISISTTAGRARWEPAGAVVFVGAVAKGGPSADCCCDYLNFFTGPAAAHAWADAHPHIPGQILDQEQAQELADQIFGHLLT